MGQKFILGIDGGGTSTHAAIIDSDGQLLGTGVGGPSNYDDVGAEIAQKNIDVTIKAAWKQAGITTPRPFQAVFLGMAGVVSPTDRQIIHQIAMKLKLAPPDKVGVDHDCRVALAGGLAGRPGIVQIAGTGSSCFGMNKEGQEWRSGGWGELISDEGSSYWLGVQAMSMAVRAYDGRGEKTILLEQLQAFLEIKHINEIMHRIYDKGITRSEVAKLAPKVIDAARVGDHVAQQLIQKAVNDLADCVQAVARKLNMLDACELTLVGGLMNARETFVSPLKQAVTKRLPNCTTTFPELSPELGACLLGMEILDIPLNSIVDTMKFSASQNKKDE